jgi:hypothetical protein
LLNIHKEIWSDVLSGWSAEKQGPAPKPSATDESLEDERETKESAEPMRAIKEEEEGLGEAV